MLALGIAGLIDRDFMPLWQPPDTVPARDALAYLCATVSVASGIGLLWRRTAALAARVLFGYLLLWTLVFRTYDIVTSPTEFGSWDGLAEAAVMVAGAWVLYASVATDWDRRRLGFVTGDKGVRIARALYGVSLIPFGLAHFFSTSTEPCRWCPTGYRRIWRSRASPVVRFSRRASPCSSGSVHAWRQRFSALQIGLVTVLVWIPIMAARSLDDFEWIEVGVSVALTAAAWVVADSYRGVPWLALKTRARASVLTARS